MLNRVRTEVIGVLPEEFDFFGEQIEFVAPLCLTKAQVDSRVGGNTVIGRLKPGVTVQQAQAEADILGAQLAASDPQRHRVVPPRGGAGRQRVRSLLVTGQIALALVLLIGAGLLIHSFVRAIRTDLGADPKNLLTFDFRLPPGETFKLAGRWRGSNLFDVNPAAAETFERVYEKLQAVPGVLAVGAANIAPFGPTLSVPFLIEGRPAPATTGPFGEGLQPSPQVANYFAVTRTFFSALGIPLLQGRDFGVHDTADQPLVMIINQTMARQYFQGEDPVGKRVTLDFVPDERPREIIAVVGDTSTEGTRNTIWSS